MILRDVLIQLLKDSPNQPAIILYDEKDRIGSCVIEGKPTGDIISDNGLWFVGCFIEGCEGKNRIDGQPPNPVPIISNTVFKNCRLPDGAHYSNCIIKDDKG